MREGAVGSCQCGTNGGWWDLESGGETLSFESLASPGAMHVYKVASERADKVLFQLKRIWFKSSVCNTLALR